MDRREVRKGREEPRDSGVKRHDAAFRIKPKWNRNGDRTVEAKGKEPGRGKGKKQQKREQAGGHRIKKKRERIGEPNKRGHRDGSNRQHITTKG